MRNFMTTLLVSSGVPMILHGDEVARTQRGYNNAYCQDNELAWQPWDLTADQRQMLAWTRRVIQLRKQYAVLRRRSYFRGRPIRGEDVKDILWLRPDGKEMSEAEWQDRSARVLSVYLFGGAADLTDDDGLPVVSPSLYIAYNSSDRAVDLTLPKVNHLHDWRLVLDSSRPDVGVASQPPFEDGRYRAGPRTVVILEHATDVSSAPSPPY